MDLDRTMEFILEQQAASAAAQARFDADIARINEKLAESIEIGRLTRLELRRAVRLGVQEARAERKRRREAMNASPPARKPCRSLSRLSSIR